MPVGSTKTAGKRERLRAVEEGYLLAVPSGGQQEAPERVDLLSPVLAVIFLECCLSSTRDYPSSLGLNGLVG